MRVEVVAGAADERSDAVLTAAVRGGDIAAYGVLYARHVGAARRFAALCTATHAEREDMAAEAFTRVLGALKCGGGPDALFRSYLFTTMRNAMVSWRRRDAAVSLVADVPERGAGSWDDGMDARAQVSLAADAFASLPQRWRMVLWHTEIEGETPAQVAPLLGMTPNSVAALAYRARKGLRKAYLDHDVSVDARACRSSSVQPCGPGAQVRRPNARVAAGDRVLDPPRRRAS